MKYAYAFALRLGALVPALILGVGLMGMPDSGARAAEWPADSYVLQIDGLACPYCGYGVEKQFQKRDGVQGTEIDVEQGVIIVSVSADTRFSDDELKQIVRDSGFALGGIRQRPEDR